MTVWIFVLFVNMQKCRNGKGQRTSAPGVIRIRISTGLVHVTCISPGDWYEFCDVICIKYAKKMYLLDCITKYVIQSNKARRTLWQIITIALFVKEINTVYKWPRPSSLPTMPFFFKIFYKEKWKEIVCDIIT